MLLRSPHQEDIILVSQNKIQITEARNYLILVLMIFFKSSIDNTTYNILPLSQIEST